jgi:hypothetical protein
MLREVKGDKKDVNRSWEGHQTKKKIVSHYVKTWYSWLEHFITDV